MVGSHRIAKVSTQQHSGCMYGLGSCQAISSLSIIGQESTLMNTPSDSPTTVGSFVFVKQLALTLILQA